MIGVFDSGIGGLSVLQALRAELPQENFIYIADSGHAPYGERDDAHVLARSRALTAHLVRQNIKALVVACNTATAAAIDRLRAEHPGLPIIGVEPALKPAALLSRTGRIGVIGTRGTVTSTRFQALLTTLQGQARFMVQPCDGLAQAIEQGVALPESEGATKIRALCDQYTRAMGKFGTEPGEIDTLVLGCTHYLFAAPQLRDLLGEQVQLIETGEPVARQTRRLLAEADQLSLPGPGTTQLFTTGQPQALQTAARHWLQLAAGAESLHF